MNLNIFFKYFKNQPSQSKKLGKWTIGAGWRMHPVFEEISLSLPFDFSLCLVGWFVFPDLCSTRLTSAWQMERPFYFRTLMEELYSVSLSRRGQSKIADLPLTIQRDREWLEILLQLVHQQQWKGNEVAAPSLFHLGWITAHSYNKHLQHVNLAVNISPAISRKANTHKIPTWMKTFVVNSVCFKREYFAISFS